MVALWILFLKNNFQNDLLRTLHGTICIVTFYPMRERIFKTKGVVGTGVAASNLAWLFMVLGIDCLPFVFMWTRCCIIKSKRVILFHSCFSLLLGAIVAHSECNCLIEFPSKTKTINTGKPLNGSQRSVKK